MRITVIGAGALGCAIAAELVNAGRDTLLIARGARLAAMKDRPLEIESSGLSRTTPVPVAASLPPSGGTDLAICCVKMPDYPAALELLDGKLSRHGTVLTVQNGVEAGDPQKLIAFGLLW